MLKASASYQIFVLVAFALCTTVCRCRSLTKRSYVDSSVKEYLTERTCWWNEVCKEEFQTMFRCKCPHYSFCRSPGRYYNAVCTMTSTGYTWTQPELSW